MKKITAIVAAFATAAAYAAAAHAADETVTLLEGASGEYYTMQNGADADTAVLAVYDDGKLVYASMSEYEDYQYTFTIPEEYKEYAMRITYIGENTYDAVTGVSVTTAAPEEETVSPTVTPEPATNTEAPTATPVPTRTPIPEIYPSAADARNAFAVVEDVSYTAQDDGNYYYVTKMLYQGHEITVSIEDDVKIDSASDAFSELEGETPQALEAGDVIHFTTNLKGKIKAIQFILRPTGEYSDYGSNFSELISKSGTVAGQSGWKVASYGSDNNGKYVYAFGIPIKKSKGELMLSNLSGKTMYVGIDEDTIVYTVSSGRETECEISSTGQSGIDITSVPKDTLDDDDNVTDLSYLDGANYIFVRMIEGTATDVVVFDN